MVVFDIETNGLLSELNTIHCINVADLETGERLRFNDQPEIVNVSPAGTVSDGVAYLQRAIDDGRYLAGHNVVRFDIPAIRMMFPDFTAPVEQVFDTLVVSRLIWTDLMDIDKRAIRRRRRPEEFLRKKLSGRHSLEAWGYRLGDYKGEFAGPWDTFTAEMDDYCAQDVEVTCKLVEKEEAENYSADAILLEHQVAEILFLQEQHGVYFDVPAAEQLAGTLVGEIAELEDKLRAAFKPWFKPVVEKGRVVVMDPKVRRTVTVTTEEGSWKSEHTPGQPYTKVKLVSFEPGSRDMIADRLKKLYGWHPVEFTEKGKPKVDETTLEGLDYPEVKLLIRYLTLTKLLGTVATGKKAWLNRVSPDGRIRSPVNSNGAVTGRMTHADHLAQVPKVKKDGDGNILLGYDGRYGFETRSLFRAPPDKVLVGVDAEGLELRMLAHYMGRFDGGAYARAVVEGDKKLGTDAHSLNMKAVQLRTRDGAKTWIYAYLYGAGLLKLGLTYSDDMSEEWRDDFHHRHAPGLAREQALSTLGKKGRSRIESGFPALGALQKDVKAAVKGTGQLRSLDGRLLNIRKQHAALNTLLQGGGAVVMKKALVLAYHSFLERGWKFGREFAFVLNVHDEFQMEVLPEYAEEVGAIAADAIRRAGEEFGLRCPLAGSADVGKTWADTH